ncbi:MAG: TolC family protein [Pseudomonadota bacterium]
MASLSNRHWLSATFLAIIAACVTPPESPQRPDRPTTAAAFDNDADAAFASTEVEASWWKAFDDPILDQLIQDALANNKNLSVAQANIDIVQARLQRQRLDPTLSTQSQAGADLGRAARDGADVEVTGNAQIGASWEYDAFGRIASEIESAEFDVLAAQETRRDVAVIVASETALAYADLRGNQVRLSVAETNAALQEDSLELLKTLFENGRATRLDLERAEAQYRATLASLPLLEANIRAAGARLVTLTGKVGLADSQSVQFGLETRQPTPRPPQTLSVGKPEVLIRRRPDIRSAEADIASLLALGEADRARLFPTLTFNANVLSLFSDNNDFGDSFGFAIGPAIRWEGPDLRRVRADIDLTDAQTRAAFARYEASVVNALGEVEIALINYTQEQARREDLEAAAVAAENAVGLARLRFEEGLDDFLDVIDAQRTLLQAQDQLEISRLTTTRQAIAAYRALGGIWTTDALDTASQSGDTDNAP